MLTRVVSSPEELPLGAASTMGIAIQKMVGLWDLSGKNGGFIWIYGIYPGTMVGLGGSVGFSLDNWWISRVFHNDIAMDNHHF